VTRVIELGGTRSLIGRQSRSRGYFPEIDLSATPEDRGVSRTHAILDHPADGSLTITDLGSSNGTWLDDAERPLDRGIAVELYDGARIYLGSWTRITLRRK
jgi:pSer/pThr/pTyr-binding forkhead associated (FHA) protein